MFLLANINKKLEEYRNTSGAVLVDVREVDEFRSGHIPGAINQPLSNISQIKIPKDFYARNCDERSVGISDPGVTGQVLVKVYRELCNLSCDECRWADWGAV